MLMFDLVQKQITFNNFSVLGYIPLYNNYNAASIQMLTLGTCVKYRHLHILRNLLTDAKADSGAVAKADVSCVL